MITVTFDASQQNPARCFFVSDPFHSTPCLSDAGGWCSGEIFHNIQGELLCRAGEGPRRALRVRAEVGRLTSTPHVCWRLVPFIWGLAHSLGDFTVPNEGGQMPQLHFTRCGYLREPPSKSGMKPRSPGYLCTEQQRKTVIRLARHAPLSIHLTMPTTAPCLGVTMTSAAAREKHASSRPLCNSSRLLCLLVSALPFSLSLQTENQKGLLSRTCRVLPSCTQAAFSLPGP